MSVSVSKKDKELDPSSTGSKKETIHPDARECLLGILKTYYSANSNGSEQEDSMMDPDDRNRVSQVEQDLLKVLLEPQSTTIGTEITPKVKLLLSSPIALEVAALHSKHAFPCSDTYRELPSHPSKWPQSPLMIRPTPHTSTKIRGIRRAKSLQYEHFSGFCAGCILPINCGREVSGESLVIDFESTHFIGTLLLRIQQAKPLDDTTTTTAATTTTTTTARTTYTKQSYFDGKKRKFQAVVKGRFRTPLPMNETVTGQTFDRPAGKLPARWIITSFIQFISTLAPQLEVKLDGMAPRFLTPLVATAQTVLQRPITTSSSTLCTDLEEEIEELPSIDSASLLPLAHEALGTNTHLDTSGLSSTARMKARKRAFNQLASHKDNTLKFDTTKEYTFEFYQHLLDFGEEGLAVDMGRPIGKVGLSRALDGQPLKFMSAHRDPLTGNLDTLWSFDIWHASLYPFAEMAVSDHDVVK